MKAFFFFSSRLKNIEREGYTLVCRGGYCTWRLNFLIFWTRNFRLTPAIFGASLVVILLEWAHLTSINDTHMATLKHVALFFMWFGQLVTWRNQALLINSGSSCQHTFSRSIISFSAMQYSLFGRLACQELCSNGLQDSLVGGTEIKFVFCLLHH